MDMVSSSFLPGDPRLIDQIVYELKSQGIFDQFRKECIADVDTKPAYQNLSQRVEGSVMNFLNKQKFSEDINKNQLREQLRKNITESGFLDSGVERIVDQVVNPKINTVFLPKVEDVVYRFLGIVRPDHDEKPEETPKIEDLLPQDLEAVSPESVHEKKEEDDVDGEKDSLNSSNTKTEDESPPFEPLEENTKFSVLEENSVDSHLSGVSGLHSHNSPQNESSNQIEISQDISMTSIQSEGHLSIITSEEYTKMETGEELTTCESNEKNMEEIIQEKPENTMANNLDAENGDKNTEDKKDDFKSDSRKSYEKPKSSRSDKERKEDKDKKDDKDKRSHSKSESKSKEYRNKSSSKHSSSSKDKDKKEYTNGKDEASKKDDKEKDRSSSSSSSKSKDKDRSDKSRDKYDKLKDKEKDKSSRDKEKSSKDKDDKEKEKSSKEKEKSESDKHKSSKDKERNDKGKSEKDKHESSSSKHSRDKSSSSSRKDSKEKDKQEEKSLKDKSSSNRDKSSSSSKSSSRDKDKDSSKSSKDNKDVSKSSSSSSRDKDKKATGDSRSRSSDKHKKSESYEKGSLSTKKEKEKKVTDDHYSLKDKKNDRRSTDRDSNDGSSKMSRNSSFAENYSSSHKGSSKDSEVFSSSGGGDSSNSDKMENLSVEPIVSSSNISFEVSPPIKLIKPKFASNLQEAMRIMKIRKMLAKLEKQNQLALANVPNNTENTVESPSVETNKKVNSAKKLKPTNDFNNINVDTGSKISNKAKSSTPKGDSPENSKFLELQIKLEHHINHETPIEDLPLLKSQDLSMENFEALEARLAQEMAKLNYNEYGDEDDCYEYSSITTSPVKKPIKVEQTDITKNNEILFEEPEEKTEVTSVNDDHMEDIVLEPAAFIETENSSIIEDFDQVSKQIKKVDFSDSTQVIGGEVEIIVAEQFTVPNDDSLIENDVIIENDGVNEDPWQEVDMVTIEEEISLDNDSNLSDMSNLELDEREVEEETEDNQKVENVSEVCIEEEIDAGHLTDMKIAEQPIIDFPQVSEEFNGFSVHDMNDSTLKDMILLINKLASIANIENSKEISPEIIVDVSMHSPLEKAENTKEIKPVSILKNMCVKNGKKILKINKPRVSVKFKDELDDDLESSEHNNSNIKSLPEEQVDKNIDSSTSLITKPPGDKDQIIKYEKDDDMPCYSLDRYNNISERHLAILNGAIVRLEKLIEEQSLQIQNNISKPKKRGRKRKSQSTENNNSISCEYKPERKKRLLADANLDQNEPNLCSTDVTSENFSLPLSPSDSDKSGEHKKEPETVKTKRTSRGSAKRYSSEDLYKPRPILNCQSTRRRSGRIDESRS